MAKQRKKISVLALSWRDIKSPTAGGAEVNTHEIFRRLDKEKFEITHFAPLYPGQNREEYIDGIRYIRRGNVLSVIMYAMVHYKRNKEKYDFVIDQCNTHRFFTPLWVEQDKRIFLIYQLTREIWDINCAFPINIIGKKLENTMLRIYRNDITITESESTKKDLMEIGFIESNINVIPIIMKIAPWEKQEFLKKNDTPTFTYVGRYAKYKGIDDAIEAIGILKEKKINTKLIIIGKKNQEYISKVLEPICARYSLSISDNEETADIITKGYISEDEKLEILSKSKALVFPSNREGWGIPISEAAYVGTPSIVYNSPGIRDAVNFGKAGYLCERNSPKSIAKKMCEILDDNQMYEIMRDKAYDFSKSYLDVNVNERISNLLI